MPQGTVKWFNNAKGYGFLLSEESGDDIFAHYSAIEMDGYKTLKAGQNVFFDLIQGSKGVHAANIRSSATAINSESPPPCSREAPVSAVESFNH
ncbi:MAG: cold shock domain-containing protein CspD [Gammaproteobacteria bacterium]|nr:cold shock domain-containing protein CspD [Gammaproteobacteria bacterium]MBQ0840612.1 cold shock domain-containing protein CspD [Gammaproteobacteria bacterium]